MRKMIIFLMIVCLFGGVPVQAQIYYSDESVQLPSYHSFDEIKRNIAGLIKRNHILEDQYKEAEAEYQSAVIDFEKKKSEIDFLKKELAIVLQKDKNDQYVIKSAYGDIETLKSEVLIKKSRIAYLQGQLLLMEDKQNLWETQLKDLENQKMQLQLNKKKNEIDIQQRIDLQKQEISALQQDIGDLNKKRDELNEQYTMIAEKTGGLSAEINQLQKDNDILKKQLVIFEKERDLLIREAEHLSKMQKMLRQNTPGYIGYNEEYEKELSREVALLEEKYRNTTAALQNKVGRRENYHALSQEFVEASKANQKLRQKLKEFR